MTTPTLTKPFYGYCWMQLVPDTKKKAFRRRYPPQLSKFQVGNIIKRYGVATHRLSYTVETLNGITFFHIFPGDTVTLEELWAAMGPDFVVASITRDPQAPRTIRSSPNSPEFTPREWEYMRFRKTGGRKYDARFPDLIDGLNAVIMPEAPSQYFHPNTAWIEFRILLVVREYCGIKSRSAWQAIVDAIGGFSYIPALLTTSDVDRPEILARTYGPVLSRSDLYSLVCDRGLSSIKIGHYPPYTNLMVPGLLVISLCMKILVLLNVSTTG